MTPHFLLAVVAALLGLIAAGDFLTSRPHELSYVGLAALLFLLEMPAFAWRMLGGRRFGTWIAAVAPPLTVGGFQLLKTYYEYEGRCADVCGVEGMVFIFVLLPLVLVTGTFVAWIATGVIRPLERN